MKTAMQELIEYVEEMYLKDDILDVIINKANTLLEKEKEQIIKAWYNGFDELRPFVDHSEDYYNQTYNQNK